jgi:hypothetical protein
MANVTVDYGGRGGDVLWRDGDLALRFAWEGTNGGFEIGVPTLDQWTDQTGLPESRRGEVLRELGEAFVRERAPRGRWSVVEAPWAFVRIHA